MCARERAWERERGSNIEAVDAIRNALLFGGSGCCSNDFSFCCFSPSPSSFRRSRYSFLSILLLSTFAVLWRSKKHEWYSVLARSFFSSYFPVCHSIIIYVIHIRYLFKCFFIFFGKYSNKRIAYSLSKHETGNRAFSPFLDIAWIVVMSCRLIVFVQYPLFYTDSIGNVSIDNSPHHLPNIKVFRIYFLCAQMLPLCLTQEWTLTRKHSPIAEIRFYGGDCSQISALLSQILLIYGGIIAFRDLLFIGQLGR